MRPAMLGLITAAMALAISFPASASPKLLDRVNREENAAHVFGSPYPQDHSPAPYAGTWHCINYAFAKEARLRQAGFAPDRMRVVEVLTERGEDHAVLLVSGRDGEWVLDNRFLEPERRADLVRYGYRFTETDLIDPALPMREWWKAVFAASR